MGNLKKNEGPIDRVVRVALAVVLVAVGLYLTVGVASVILYILTAISLVTAATGYCGVYALFGWSTCPAPKTAPAQPASGQPKA